jgi:hypothetical protein
VTRVAALLSVACLVGCAPAPKTAAPAAAPDLGVAPPTTVEEAQAQVDRAHVQLGGVLASVGTQATGAAGGPAGGPTAAEPRDATTGSVDMSRQGEPKQEPCATACRAIASMQRAVDTICRIAGADDRRCLDARKTLADDSAKTARCGCP